MTYPAAKQLGGSSGNATAADLLQGSTASNDTGPISGNIPIISGGNSISPSTANQTAITAATYTQNAITVTAVTGTAAAGDLRVSKTASSANGIGFTGTLAEVSGGNAITPSAASQTAIAANTIANAAITVAAVTFDATKLLTGTTVAGTPGTMPNITSGNQLQPATTQTNGASGYYGPSYEPFVAAEPNYLASNIKYNVPLWGLTGAFTSDATAIAADIATGKTAYALGAKLTGTAKRYSSGEQSASSGSFGTISVSGLPFTPSRVIVLPNLGGTDAAFDSDVSTTTWYYNGSSYSCTYSTSSGAFTWQNTGYGTLVGVLCRWIALE